MLITAGCFLSACSDEAGPTAPAPAATPTPFAAPLIAGTWSGTVTSGGTTTCPITLEIEQPRWNLALHPGTEVTGRIESRCGLPKADFHRGAIHARLVGGMPWSIVGSVEYTNNRWTFYGYGDGTFTTNLRASLEGSPVSRISATSDGFRKKGARTGGDDPMQFEVTRSGQ